tara:strand:- start:5 stop:1372 length:1368 start_codon:yes stop_codon:yes gene_type:complete
VVIGIKTKILRANQYLRVLVLVLLLIHVAISAWLVVNFSGEYTEGAPAPTKIDAIVVVDREETLIDVEMEQATSFLLYMIYRDYDESYGQNNSDNNSQNNNQNDAKTGETENNSDDSDFLGVAKSSIYLSMMMLLVCELLVLLGIKFSSMLRWLAFGSLILCFFILLPASYIYDLAGEGDDSDESLDESLADETFVESTESGSIAHEKSNMESQVIFPGIRLNLDYSGYDLGLVDPQEYSELRAEIPSNNSSLADSYIEFQSTLDLTYGKNLPALLLIPLTWYLFPTKQMTRISIKELKNSDIDEMVEINEQGLPGTGKVSQTEMMNLLNLSELKLGAYVNDKLVGFALCLLPKTNYGSLNYAWFNERYDEFIYVDRIAVATDSRNQGIGSMLYERLFEYAKSNNIPVTAEVSLRPPNEGSDRFHLRHGYQVVGELDHGEKAVTMYIKHFPHSND